MTITSTPVPTAVSTPRRIRRSIAALVVTAVASVGVVAAGPSKAQARDSNCKAVPTLNGNKRVSKYIPVGGWGLTAWRVKPFISAWDRCNHGELFVGVPVDDSGVTAKGGQLRISSVSYQVSGRSTWTSLPRIHTWPQSEYRSSHVDMTRTARIAKVKIVTAVWIKQDGSNWVGAASDTMICDLIARSCS